MPCEVAWVWRGSSGTAQNLRTLIKCDKLTCLKVYFSFSLNWFFVAIIRGWAQSWKTARAIPPPKGTFYNIRENIAPFSKWRLFFPLWTLSQILPFFSRHKAKCLKCSLSQTLCIFILEKKKDFLLINHTIFIQGCRLHCSSKNIVLFRF